MRILRPTILIGVVSALVLFGFGCKGLSPEEKAAIKPIALEYWTVYENPEALDAVIKKYTQLRPHITVKVKQFRADEIYTKLVEALSIDKGPDIISVNNRDLGAYLNKLNPMPASIKDTTVVYEKGQLETKTSITSRQRQLVTMDQLGKDYVQAVKKDVVRNGKIYGLPLSFDVMALYYNKDILDRAGIPVAPKTWIEFQEQVKKLTKFDKASGKISLAGAAIGSGENVVGSSDILYVLFEQSDLPFVNSSGKAVFNQRTQSTSNELSSQEFVVNFYTDFANPTRDTYSWNETMPNALDSFVNGSAAFFFGYSYHRPVIKQRAPQMNFEVVPMLQLNPEAPVNVANYWVQSVVQKSKHPNEAWGLIDYLTHSAAVKDYLDKSERPTAIRAYVSKQKEVPELEPFASQVLTASNWYFGKNYPAADKALKDMFKEWLQPVKEEELKDWHQQVLNRAASKVNQTF